MLGSQTNSMERKLPTVLLAYRENEAFQILVPIMMQTLKSMGYKVEIASVPQGTKEEEILKWVAKNQALFTGKEIVSDGTLSNILAKNQKLNFGGYLDGLSEKVTRFVLLGENAENLTDEQRWEEHTAVPLEETGKAYTTLVQRIIENRGNFPNMVRILRDKISDHPPFHTQIKQRSTQTVGEDFLNERREEETSIKKIINIIRSWLVEAGIPEEIITEKQFDDISKIDQRGNWIILDRHSRETIQIKNALVLYLPLASFLRSAQNAGLITLGKDEFELAIKRQVEKDFLEDKKIA